MVLCISWSPETIKGDRTTSISFYKKADGSWVSHVAYEQLKFRHESQIHNNSIMAIYELYHEKNGFLHMQNKDAGQMCGNRTTDQCLCFLYIDSSVQNPEDRFSHVMAHIIASPRRTVLSGFALFTLPVDSLIIYSIWFLGYFLQIYLSCVMRKPVFWVSDKVWHKPGCTATENG